MWKYQELLNQNLQIILVILLGFMTALIGTFKQGKDLHTINKVVFRLLLPSSVLLGLGIKSDLRDGELWKFVGAFLLLRAICLICSFVLLLNKSSIAVLTMNWLVISWVSTVILGVPLIRAALGPQFANLGVIAGISSFIFQLPLMLILFEYSTTKNTPSSLPDSNAAMTDVVDTAERKTYFLSFSQWKSILVRICTNPILISILIGIILSVTTLGPKFLNPGNLPAQPNCSYAPGAGFIFLLVSSLAACTEPIALMGIGIFLWHKNPFKIGILKAIIYMIIKLILVPAISVGCAAAVGLQGATARAAVLLAALPISSAAFALSSMYNVGDEVVTSNVFLGNLLVLPTTLAWMSFMDAVELFPVGDGTMSGSGNSTICAG